MLRIFKHWTRAPISSWKAVCIPLWCHSHTFISSHWLPAAEITTSILCTNGCPYKVLLPHCQTCNAQWWGGRCAGVCGKRGSGCPILNDILWIGQSTQVSWSRPADPECSLGGQRLQWDHAWGTHCSKGIGTFMASLHVLVFLHFIHQWGPWTMGSMDSKRCRISCTNCYTVLCMLWKKLYIQMVYEQGVGMWPLASEAVLPLVVETMGVQQTSPYPSSVCACALTVYIVACARPVIV